MVIEKKSRYSLIFGKNNNAMSKIKIKNDKKRKGLYSLHKSKAFNFFSKIKKIFKGCFKMSSKCCRSKTKKTKKGKIICLACQCECERK